MTALKKPPWYLDLGSSTMRATSHSKILSSLNCSLEIASSVSQEDSAAKLCRPVGVA